MLHASPAHVVVITRSSDSGAALVLEALSARGARAVRLDTDRLATDVQVSLWQDQARAEDAPLLTIVDGGVRIEIARNALAAVWVRRLGYAADGLDADVAGACLAEQRAFLSGLLTALPCFVLDPLPALRHAEDRVRLQRVAVACGFVALPAVHTSDPSQAAAFLRAHPHVVARPWTSHLVALEQTNAQRPARLLSDDERADPRSSLASLCGWPTTFHWAVDGQVSRVVVVGAEVFGASSTSLGERCVAVCHALGLHHAVLEVVEGNDGPVLLEVDPTADALALPDIDATVVAEALARTLLAPLRDRHLQHVEAAPRVASAARGRGLILTNAEDRSWDLWPAMAQTRATTGEPFWQVRDSSLVPTQAHVTVDGERCVLGPVTGAGSGDELDLTRLDVAWLKRHGPLGVSAQQTESEHADVRARHEVLCRMQCAALHDAGVGVFLDDVAWWHLQGKLLQHEAARSVGLRAPRTLVSNDAAALRAFVATCPDGAIYKPLTRVVVGDARVMTSVLGLGDLDDDDAVRWCPLLVQERVVRDHELRVTVIGDAVTAAAVIDTDASHVVDWRRGQETQTVQWSKATLPDDVQAALLRLMDVLGLAHGGADFVVTAAGEHVFLEVNPTGEFLFIEHFLGEPLSSRWLDHLERGPCRQPRLWSANGLVR